MSVPVQMRYDSGTIVLGHTDDDLLRSLPGAQFDARNRVFRAEGRNYRAIVETLRARSIPYSDEARQFQPTPWSIKNPRTPYPHQTEAMNAWWKHGGRGVVVLPTGTGKTYVALLAIQHLSRPSLIVTPTIDLMYQWQSEMTTAFDVPVGLLGGGSFDLQPLTVTTYDSAYIHLERWGDRFGLIVFDECHHLPGASFQYAAIGAIAPYRLGLTATPERADGADAVMPALIGPIIYRREIKQLAGDFLAEYRVERREVDLSPEDKQKYAEVRGVYRGFVERERISLGTPTGWKRFLQAAWRSAEGRAAFQAFREQRRLALAAPAKIQLLDELLRRHAGERTLIFTYDNVTVYRIARQFLVPAITHQTKAKERKRILQRFHAGEYNVVVTSQVLNEGVDVPAAAVGIILSGTGSVREHVQRLGRLLRKHGDKQALLYEVVTRDTAEQFTSERRRQHHAYQ